MTVEIKMDLCYVDSKYIITDEVGMNNPITKISGSEFKNFIKALDSCMDDHLYILDMKNDVYCISDSAVKRFDIPQAEIEHASVELMKFTYPDDRDILAEDIRQLVAKEKTYHNMQYRWLDKEGQPIWINCRGQVLQDDSGEPEYLIGCINEIGKKQKADNVSGLLGAFSFQNEIKEYGDQRLRGYILRLDIDNFREINEKKGLSYGDLILKKTAEYISETIQKGTNLYRIVADEFLIVDFNGTVEEAKEIYRTVCKKVNEYISDIGYEVFFTFSAGILNLESVVNQEYENLMKLTEFALNIAKSRGKNRYYIYEKEDYQKFLHRNRLLRIMRQSVNQNFEGFEAYFQPVVDIEQKHLCGAETLLRFRSEETGFVSPVEFIPLLEESGLIIPVGKWVLDQAMLACSRIREYIEDFRVSVNISYVQVLKSDILTEIKEGIRRYGLKEEHIMVELTESGFLEKDENFLNFCEGLRENKIPLALDDFGTGYSNFHYLYDLKPNTIKIDRSLTLKALKRDYEYNLLYLMGNMAHSIGLKLCVEGIESKTEYEKICEMGPDYIQGYYFGKPCPFGQFVEEFVKKEVIVD